MWCPPPNAGPSEVCAHLALDRAVEAAARADIADAEHVDQDTVAGRRRDVPVTLRKPELIDLLCGLLVILKRFFV